MRIRITLTAGLALTAVAVFAVLQRRPLETVTTNGVQASTAIGVVQEAGAFCQPAEKLPREISALRLSFGATTGPKIVVTVTRQGQLLTEGATAAGWYGSAVTVAVKPLPRAYPNVTICTRFGSLIGDVGVLGEPVGTGESRSTDFVPGLLSVVYLRPGRRSWWSLAGSVIDRMALGRAASGTWIVIPIAALIVTAIGLAWIALKRDLG